jgi:DNA-binding GntR family transcriptional regulator
VNFLSKSDFVADGIRDMIRNGELGPGATLRQRDIAERFGVSPTPVREALRRLEAEGFIVTQLHRGATVVRPEASRLIENFRIRAVLESLAAEVAAERVTGEDLEEIAALHHELAECDPEDPTVFDDLNRRFHFRVYESARSPVLSVLLNHLWQALGLPPTVLRGHADSVKQHGALLEALQAGDAKRAAELTRHHVEEVMSLAAAAATEPDAGTETAYA